MVIINAESPFGDFYMQSVAGNLIFLADSLHISKNIRQLEIHPGKIQRNPGFLPALAMRPDPAKILTGLPDCIQIQLMDEMGILQYLDKHSRRYHAILRGIPACQRLNPDDLPRHRADFRLIPHLNIVVFQCPVKIANDVILDPDRLFLGLIKNAPALIVSALYAFTSQLCPVEDQRRILATGRWHINSHLDL